MKTFEKYPLKFWKDLLEKFQTSKIPVKCDEECMLEIMVTSAEEMEVALKALKKVEPATQKNKRSGSNPPANSQAIEILERYRLQQVKLPDAEKLLEKIKLKEDALSIIEKRLY
jgi:cell envelope opacity-associated protein A